MTHHQLPKWRATRIPLRLIDDVYGKDNYDNAGDDVAYALTQVSDYPKQYRSRFEFDTSHVNPWYHVMIFEIEGLPDSVYARFLALIAELGLAESRL